MDPITLWSFRKWTSWQISKNRCLTTTRRKLSKPHRGEDHHKIAVHYPSATRQLSPTIKIWTNHHIQTEDMTQRTEYLHRVMNVVSSIMCPCGEAGQDTCTFHFLRACINHQALKRNMARPNTAPGEAVWSNGFSTEYHQIRWGNKHPSVMANDKNNNMLQI